MKNCILTYDTPAKEWIEGLPVGNGTIGAMLFGNPGEEIITLNHDRLWRNNVEKEIRTAGIIPEMRRLVLEGKALEAEELFKKETACITSQINPYQVFCNLRTRIAGISEFSGYMSGLDLGKGIASVCFSSRKASYSYNLFASRSQGAIILKLSTDRRSSFDFSFSFERPEDPGCKWKSWSDGNRLIFNGEFTEGIRFAAVADVSSLSGKLESQGSVFSVKDASEILIRIVLEPGFNGTDPLETCLARLGKSMKNFDDIRADHISEHGSLFNRVELDIGAPEENSSTEKLYNSVFENGEISPAIYELFFNMARYLMISASRPGSLPVNLQGLWNDSIAPAWESGFTMDMNMQMQYWMALPCNLFECELPVFNWITGNMERMRKQSKDIFGVEGAYIPQYTDFKMTPKMDLPHGSFQVLWPGAATWMAQHFFEYWKYTCDDKFMRETAFPYMKDCARFMAGHLARDPSGKFISCPSSSPENRTKGDAWVVNTPTMDISLVQELMEHLLEVDRKLKIADPDAPKWKELLENLHPYPLDPDGTLREWVEKSDMKDPGHRHISHIYGLFPGKLFTQERNPRLYDAAVKAIIKRRENGFGSCATWSHAWYTCCFSRMRDGDAALESIDNIIRSGLLRNFLTTHNDWRDSTLSSKMIKFKLFQIEALLGACAAIAEMIVQSFDDGIFILPSLPEKWQIGTVRGLRAYGGFEIGIGWSEGKIREIRVESHSGGECTLVICGGFLELSMTGPDGEKHLFESEGNRITFKTSKGGKYIIMVTSVDNLKGQP